MNKRNNQEVPQKATAKATPAPIIKNRFWREVVEWLVSIVLAVVLALVLKAYVFTIVLVDGTSMTNTLQNNDRLFVTRILYQPKQGDIVVFEPYEDDNETKFIKRIIALGGQEVTIDFEESTVFVDGQQIDEPYVREPEWFLKEGEEKNWEQIDTDISTDEIDGQRYAVVVPEEHLFVMGDNRNGSKDSRSPDVGMVKVSSLVGKALFRIYPFNTFGGIY